MRRSLFRWLADSLLICAIVAGSLRAAPPPSAPAGPGPAPPPPTGEPKPLADLVRFERNLAGDAKPVVVSADDVFTWAEGGRTVVLTRGKVLLQQSFLQTRCDAAVFFIDNDRYRRSGIWDLFVYCDGHVHLDNSSEIREGNRGALDLHTRGELKFSSQRGRVLREPMADDPLVTRARSERPAPVPTARTNPPAWQSIRRTGLEEPAPPMPFLPGGLGAPTGGPRPVQPTAPPETPVPVNPPRPGGPSAALHPPSRIGTAAVEAPPIVEVRLGYYQPESAPPPASVPTPGPAPSVAIPPPASIAGPPSAIPSAPAADPAPPPSPPRRFSIVGRSGPTFDVKVENIGNSEQAAIISGGVILQIQDVPGIGLLDVEADQLVLWTKGNDAQQLAQGFSRPEGQTARDIEFYLKGNVEIRKQNKKDSQILRADEVYYDVNRNVAIALSATLEMRVNPQPGKAFQLTDPVFFRTDELQQLSATKFKVLRSEIFSSKLPSDPGLKVYVTEATIDEAVVPRKTIFGTQVFNRTTGEAEQDRQTLVKSKNVFFELENVPFFYLPFLNGDANDPLGPVQNINIGYGKIYGLTLDASLDMYTLLGIQPYQDTKWRLNLDYLGNRGPGIGSDFDYSGKELFGLPAKYDGFIRAYAMYDDNFDVLGGPRPVNDYHPPDFRGRLTWRQGVYDLPEGFSVQSQLSVLSDRNYMEMYYKREFDSDINQETFIYVKQQQDFWAWTALVEPRIRNWVTETESLPALQGYLLGVNPFDVLTSNTRVNLGFYRLRKTTDPELPVSTTDVGTDTGRFDLYEELSYPFYLGPVKTVPYVKGSVTGYTEDINGDASGRLWGGFGLRASLPLTRIYPDVESELFNLKEINHKIVISGNYFYAGATDPSSKYPQLDRLNDDATDQAIRDLRPLLPTLNPAYGTALATLPMFDPQLYALRRLVDNRIDTRDAIEVLQFDIRQRWQTKRGYPGVEHIVDWMTLDLSASFFPRSTRDGFGDQFGFLEYDYVWNIGDRTQLTSTGWIDPVDDGAKVFTIGMYFNRPDRTNFYLGYRQIEPVQSRAVTGAVTYIFSPKYAMTASTTYDFGTSQSLSNSLVVTRIGSDIQVSLGVTYNAITQNFGAVVEIVPNLVPQNRRLGGIAPNSVLK